ncbi:MarR family winged helix-turn-helix transcriptional regulator [Mycobacterium sp. Marseille-P9652]|uniref:MarR family winged helix-turn-helix transcriptional regulator n=1 Tax=Mycobacterium sp. Marseille-P9652 TaxID=2654950 RepID=UPI0012E83511|nr:MarR family transcriptional regulator [Mycobacterium sp. Marseille-P9652]
MVVESGYRSPQTDLGQALRVAWWSYVHRLDADMEAAGYPERRAAMNYVFALYAQPGPMTISEMGRQFDVSRQAASKIVAELGRRGYVETAASESDQREKVVVLTPKAIEHVTARRKAAAKLDRAIRKRVGDAGLARLHEVLDALGEVSRGTAEFDPANLYRAPNLW